MDGAREPESPAAAEEGDRYAGVLGAVRLAYYRYKLWTGLYMLDAKERAVINTMCAPARSVPLPATWCRDRP